MTLSARITLARTPVAWSRVMLSGYRLAVMDGARVVWMADRLYASRKAAQRAGVSALMGLSS